MKKFNFISGILVSLVPLSSVVAGQSNSTGSFLVGAARVDITPEPNPYWLPLDEYDLEKLHIRAIVFSNNGVTGALLSAELVSTSDAVFKNAAAQVAAELNTPVANVILAITHSHSAGPAGPDALTIVPGYAAAGAVGSYPSFSAAAVDAAQKAKANMKPGKVGYDVGAFYLNVNRDALSPINGRWTQATNLTGPVDRDVQVLSFLDMNNVPIASYTSYAMHPVQSYLSGYTNADWPGAMSRWIEKAFATSNNDSYVAMLSQQASGDVNPLLRRTGSNTLASMNSIPITGLEFNAEAIEEPVRDQNIPLVKPDVRYIRQLFDELTALGTMLGEEVIRVMSATSTWDNNPTIWGGQLNATCPGRVRLDSAREGVSGEYALPAPDINILTSVVALGEIAVAAVGAEIFTRIGFRIKAESSLNKTMLVTLANGHASSGYVPDALSINQTCFQVLGSNLLPGSCAEVNISSSISTLVGNYRNSTGL